MSPDKNRIDETITALKQQCDELALQIHLGKTVYGTNMTVIMGC